MQIYRKYGLFAAIFAYIIKVNLYNKEFLTINIKKRIKTQKSRCTGSGFKVKARRINGDLSRASGRSAFAVFFLPFQNAFKHVFQFGFFALAVGTVVAFSQKVVGQALHGGKFFDRVVRILIAFAVAKLFH